MRLLRHLLHCSLLPSFALTATHVWPGHTPTPIPDNGPPLLATPHVPACDVISGRVEATISHSRPDDLEISLVPPDGEIQVRLMHDRGSYYNFASTTISWVDTALETPAQVTNICCSISPCCQNAFELQSENKELDAYINGKLFPAGNWTLQVNDAATRDTGNLEYFALILECSSSPVPTTAPTTTVPTSAPTTSMPTMPPTMPPTTSVPTPMATTPVPTMAPTIAMEQNQPLFDDAAQTPIPRPQLPTNEEVSATHQINSASAEKDSKACCDCGLSAVAGAGIAIVSFLIAGLAAYFYNKIQKKDSAGDEEEVRPQKMEPKANHY